jgi:hypothetical protein
VRSERAGLSKLTARRSGEQRNLKSEKWERKWPWLCGGDGANECE